MKNENVTVDLLTEEDLTHWPYEHRYKLKCDIDMYHELSCTELISDDKVPQTYNKLFEKYKDNITSITELICILYMKTAESMIADDYKALGIYYSLLIKTQDYLFEHFTGEDIEYCEQTVNELTNDKKE